MRRYRTSSILISLALAVYLFSLGSLIAYPRGKLRVVTTLNWLGYLVKRVGGDKVEVVSIVNPKVDPHRIYPRPSYVRYFRRADLLVYAGLFLESGYLPKLVEISRNPRISPNSIGDLDCSRYIPVILERVQNPEERVVTADVHPFGNPHYQYYPEDVIAAAKAITDRLSQIDPGDRDYFTRNFQSYKEFLEDKAKEWKRRLSPLRGAKVVEYHKSFEYLAAFSGFKIIATLEPIPGVPPSPAHLEKVAKLVREEKPFVLLTNVYYETRTPEKLKEATGLDYLILPHDLNSMPGTDTYEDMMDLIVEKLLSAWRRYGAPEEKGTDRS